MPAPQVINTIAVVISIGLLLLMVKDKIYGLLAYACISFTRPGNHFPFLASLRFEMIVAIVVLIVIFVSAENRKLIKITRNDISKRLFIFLAVVLASTVFSVDFKVASERSWEFLKIYAFWLMIVGLIRTEKHLNLFLWTFCFLIAYIAYEPIYNYFTGVLRMRGETAYAVASTGRGAGHVALGIYLCQGLSFLWYLVTVRPKIVMRVTGYFLILICFTGIMVSGSRGAIVGLVMFFLLISYYSKHRIKLFLATGIIFIVAMILMGSDYISYMSTILDFGASDRSAASRFEGLRHGFEMLIRKPVFGVGPGCYPVARRMWFGWGLWSHNIYGQLAGDLGLAGLIAWGLFVFTYLKECFLMKRAAYSKPLLNNIMMAVIVSNIVCLVLGFFAHMLYGYFWYMSAGIVVVLADLKNRDLTTLERRR